MTMYRYSVGESFIEGQTSMKEGVYLHIDYAVTITVVLDGPTPNEVHQFKASSGAPARFAWVDTEHAGVLCVKFGSLPWLDAPYTPHVYASPPKPPAAYLTGMQQLVTLNLVDGSTGLIVAMRAVSWPSQFVNAVGATLVRMLNSPPNPGAHDAAVDALYARYPDTKVMVRDRADITCTGGTTPDAVADGTGPDASPR